ncbi:MAG: Crp/Fnr family transcriptional regulator [Chryseolinea sp.]
MISTSNKIDAPGALLHNIRRVVDLTAETEQQLISILQTSTIKKRQFIDQPGFISMYRNYVVKGAFRSFLMDAHGKEHTVHIAVEDWFASDFYSYVSATPATLFVEALEDSIIIKMKHDDIEDLCKRNHIISEYFRITTEWAFAFSRKRALSILSKKAEDRYVDFLTQYPGISKRVPQKVIASYLGITPEFLSKLRKDRSKNLNVD